MKGLAPYLLSLATFAARPVTVPEPEFCGPLEDGSELVVVPVPGARTTSLRWVVRSGGSMDPHGRAGLAHLVEHLTFHGSYDVTEERLWDSARAEGARLNAHTTHAATTFELDAPSGSFKLLAEQLIKVITSPAWDRADIYRERGVIGTESSYGFGQSGVFSLVDDAVFPAPAQGGALIGTKQSLEEATREDVARFYAANYATTNTTIVMVGAISVAEAKTLLGRAVRLPPALPAERVKPPVETPSLPMNQKIWAGVTLTTLGYAIDPRDRPYCASIASLLQLRLQMSLKVRTPAASEVTASCVTLRGTPFVLALAYTRSLDTEDLPKALREGFEGLARTRISPRELSLLQARAGAHALKMRADPPGMAEAIARAAIELRVEGRTDLASALRPKVVTPGELPVIAARSFRPEREVMLHLTPLEQ